MLCLVMPVLGHFRRGADHKPNKGTAVDAQQGMG